MSTIIPEAPRLIPPPRQTPTGPALGDLPHVENIDGRLCVVFPPSCTWPAERRDQFVAVLAAETERIVRDRQIAKAAAKGLV